MENNKISIIIPIYNVEKYIRECLDSIINQTYKNLEIILIDDGSKDSSGKICDEYANKDNRIIVIHQKNSGVSIARNKGLDIFSGDYVMFVDPDDWIEPNTCELLLKEIQETKKDIIIFNFFREYEDETKKNMNFIFNEKDKNFIYKLQSKILASFVKIENFEIIGAGLACNKMIDRNIINNNRFPLEGKKAIFEDGLFYYNLLEQTNKVGFLNKYLYHYRIIQDSATYKYNNQYYIITDYIYNNITKLEANHKKDELFYQSLYVRMIYNLCNGFNIYLFNKKNEVNITKKIKILKKELKKEQYKQAIKCIDMNLIPLRYKIYVILFKYKLYYTVFLLNKIENIRHKLKKRRN